MTCGTASLPRLSTTCQFGKGRKHDLTNPVANAVPAAGRPARILTLQGGFPITVTNSQDTSNVGGFFDRPNATGQTAALPRGEQDPQRFFNTGAFVINNIGQFGNVGRNTLTSPGIIGWDFSMLKNFNLASETKFLQLRFEWFNFPNHPELGQSEHQRVVRRLRPDHRHAQQHAATADGLEAQLLVPGSRGYPHKGGRVRRRARPSSFKMDHRAWHALPALV